MQLGTFFLAIDKEALWWHRWIDESMTAQYAAHCIVLGQASCRTRLPRSCVHVSAGKIGRISAPWEFCFYLLSIVHGPLRAVKSQVLHSLPHSCCVFQLPAEPFGAHVYAAVSGSANGRFACASVASRKSNSQTRTNERC
jgi:hypothetical protein